MDWFFDFCNTLKPAIIPGIIGGVTAELLIRWWYKRNGKRDEDAIDELCNRFRSRKEKQNQSPEM